MNATQAAIIARDLFDTVRMVPPVFQLMGAHLVNGVWLLECLVDSLWYDVRIRDADSCIQSINHR